MRLYRLKVSDCTECPNFFTDTKYDGSFHDCFGALKMEFFCNGKKIRNAVQDEKGVWQDSYCEIPDWCPLEEIPDTIPEPVKCDHCRSTNFYDVAISKINSNITEKERICMGCGIEMGYFSYGTWKES